jgi:hypothetical protein
MRKTSNPKYCVKCNKSISTSWWMLQMPAGIRRDPTPLLLAWTPATVGFGEWTSLSQPISAAGHPPTCAQTIFWSLKNGCFLFQLPRSSRGYGPSRCRHSTWQEACRPLTSGHMSAGLPRRLSLPAAQARVCFRFLVGTDGCTVYERTYISVQSATTIKERISQVIINSARLVEVAVREAFRPAALRAVSAFGFQAPQGSHLARLAMKVRRCVRRRSARNSTFPLAHVPAIATSNGRPPTRDWPKAGAA